MHHTLTLSVLCVEMLAAPLAVRAATPIPVACCPVETTFVFREPEYPGSSSWDTTTFPCRLRSVLLSDDGRFRAGTYSIEAPEAGSMVLLCDGERVLGLQPFALALAWEPGGGRLLCHESAADDELRLFVLDVAAGDYPMQSPGRLAHVIGRLHDRFVRWQGDSVLVDNPWDHADGYHWLRLPARRPAGR
jgi:hypothetical protein